MSDQLSLLPPQWVCEYCRLPEAQCVAAHAGFSITLVDANHPEKEDD